MGHAKQLWGQDHRARAFQKRCDWVALCRTGPPRTEPLDDLAALQMGVRVDQEGQILRDWHTAGADGYLRASGGIERKNVITSTRYYLSDAAFLVGLESDDPALLQEIHQALNNPALDALSGQKILPAFTLSLSARRFARG